MALGWDLVILGFLVKLLLLPAYYSTDFDVHRNWLAITHHLPLSEWYFEATSQWTLDYPPLFAYFEYVLSWIAPQSVIADGGLQIIAEDGQSGWPTIVFQRLSVMATELVFAYSLHRLGNRRVAALLWMSPSWLILDHIHFQYNTAMFGLFVLSVLAMTRKRYLVSASLFSTLLCFKHIYLYVAPAYIAGLLWNYVLVGGYGQVIDQAAKLALATLAPIAIAFGPFVYAEFVGGRDGLLLQVVARLFPFSRGLTHAYWAPNFWALYTFADRALGVFYHNSVEAGTRGIVGQVAFANLPEIKPSTTFVATLALQVFSVLKVSTKRNPQKFVESVTLCGFAAFLFGWHVHEKAVMTVAVPFALLTANSPRHARAFLPLLASSCLSLFPLIWTPSETILKSVYAWAYLVVVFYSTSKGAGALNWLYLTGFAAVMLAYVAIPFLLPKYEFAGLMLVSVYSALGVVWSWLQLLWIYYIY